MAKKNSLKEVPYTMVRRFAGRDVNNEQTWETYRKLDEYPSDYNGNTEWLPNEPFEATLTLIELERGRSAARFWWKDQEGTHYPMFGQGIVEMLLGKTLDHGVVSGTWIAVKRGANYGIEAYS